MNLRGIIQHLAFCDWLISLGLLPSKLHPRCGPIRISACQNCTFSSPSLPSMDTWVVSTPWLPWILLCEPGSLDRVMGVRAGGRAESRRGLVFDCLLFFPKPREARECGLPLAVILWRRRGKCWAETGVTEGGGEVRLCNNTGGSWTPTSVEEEADLASQAGTSVALAAGGGGGPLEMALVFSEKCSPFRTVSPLGYTSESPAELSPHSRACSLSLISDCHFLGLRWVLGICSFNYSLV